MTFSAFGDSLPIQPHGGITLTLRMRAYRRASRLVVGTHPIAACRGMCEATAGLTELVGGFPKMSQAAPNDTRHRREQQCEKLALPQFNNYYELMHYMN
jgi:hypothetical protein